MNHRTDINIIIIGMFVLLISGCSSRMDSPVINDEDGSVTYNPKDEAGITAEVLLYKGIDEDTGLPLTAGSFTLGENSKVYADVRLVNKNSHPDQNLMFHLDWIDPTGNSFFKKRIDLTSGDTLTELKSAISAETGRRDTGEYKFRVYLFRELIAEKRFSLTSYNVDSAKIFSQHNSGKITAQILTGSGYDKKIDMPEDTASVFTMKDDARIYAGIKLLNEDKYRGKDLEVDIAWTDPQDNSIFSKTIHFSPYDEIKPIRSSVSIGGNSREPGLYKLKVYLFGRLVNAKQFKLVKEKKQKTELQTIKGIRADITFCSRYNRKDENAEGVSDSFIIKETSRVYAVVNYNDTGKNKDLIPEVKLEWIDSENKTFYSKSFQPDNNNPSSLFYSSISVTPDKRTAGIYKCRVFYNTTLISEKAFTLTNSPQ